MKFKGGFLLLCSYLLIASVYGQVISTTAGGSWSSSSTWVGNVVPVAGQDVVINGPVTLNVNTPLLSSLTINSGVIFTVSGTPTVSVTGAITINGLYINSSTGLISAGLISVNNGGIYRHVVNGGTVPTATWNTGSTCTIWGITNSLVPPAGLNQNFYNFNWNCAAQANPLSIPISTVVGLFSLINTNSNLLTLSASTVSVGGLSVAASAKMLAPSNALMVTGVTGTFTIDGMYTSNGETVFFSGTNSVGGAKLATTNLNNVTVNAGAQITLTKSITIAGTSLTNNGTISAGSNTINLAGVQPSFTNNGVFNSGTGTVAFSGTSPQIMNGTSDALFNILNINNSTGVSIASSQTISGTLILTKGLLTTNGVLTLAPGSTIDIEGTTAALSSSPNGSAWNVKYNPKGNYSTSYEIPPSGVVSSLTSSNTTGSTVSLTQNLSVASGGMAIQSGIFSSSTFTVSTSSLTVASSATFTEPTTSLTLTSGNLTVNGVYTSAGTLVFAGNSNQTISGSGASTTVFNNLTINSGSVFSSPATLYMKGNFLNNGTFNAGSAFYLQGNFTDNGSFHSGTCILTLYSSKVQTISGSVITQFYDLVVNKGGGSASITTAETITDNFTMKAGTFYFNSPAPIIISGSASTFTMSGGTANVVGTGGLSMTGGASVVLINAGTLGITNNLLNLANGATINLANTVLNAGVISTSSPSGGPWNVIYSGTQNRTTGLEIPSSGSILSLSCLNSGPSTIKLNNSLNVGSGGITINSASSASPSFNSVSNTIATPFLNIVAGSFLAPSTTLTINSGDLTAAGTFKNNSGTVGFTGISQAINGTSPVVFNKVTMSGSGTKSLHTSITVLSNLTVNNGTSLDFGNIFTNVTNALTLGGISQANGTWGSSASAATHINNTYFASASGYVTVGCSGTPSSTPTVCINSAMAPITISVITTSIGTPTGLPSGTTAVWSSYSIKIYGTPSTSGVFNYSIPLTGGCTGQKVTGSITVTPKAAITSVTGASPLCVGATATYSTTGLVLGGGTGSWTSGNTSVATVDTNTGLVTAVGAGTCNIIYTVTGGCGGTVSAQQALTVNSPSVAGSISGATAVCPNVNNTTLTLTGYQGTIQWQSSSDNASWAAISGATSSSYNAVNLTASTYYRVVVTNGVCASAASASVAITVIPTTTKIWTGNSSNDWFTASNWKCGVVPTSTDDVIIPTGQPVYPVITAAITAKSININLGGSLTMNQASSASLTGDFTIDGTYIDNGATISFSGSPSNIRGASAATFYNLTVTSGSLSQENTGGIQLVNVLTLGSNIFDTDGASNNTTFTLLSTSEKPTADASIAPLTGANPSLQLPGQITVQRYMGRIGVIAYDYQVWRDISSPVQNATVANLQQSLPVTGNFSGHNDVTGANNTVASLITYSEPTNTYPQFPVASNTETFTPGKGYQVFIFGPDSEHPVGSGNDSWYLTGLANCGDITMNCTYTTGAANKGFNLVGNPYPSTLNWNAIPASSRPHLNNAIYIDNYNTASGSPNFASWVNNVSTNGGSQYIAMGQSFWVQANATSASITFKEAYKATGGKQTTFFRESAQDNLLRIALGADETKQRDETVIYFVNDATEGVDAEYDAEKMMNKYGHLNLSSFTNSGAKFAINALPSASCSQEIGLEVSNVNSGIHRLNFSGLSSFTSGLKIVLEDKYQQSLIDIAQDQEYTFVVDKNNPKTYGSERFSIRFISCSPVGDLTSDIKLYPNPVRDLLTIEVQSQELIEGELYNSLGLKISSVTFDEFDQGKKATYDFSQLSSGIYFVRVVKGGKTVVFRIINAH